MLIEMTRITAAARPVKRLAASVLLAAVMLAPTVAARAQENQPPAAAAPEPRRVVVTGEGSVSVAPDYARIRSGVTTRGKTAKEAADANAKAMTEVIAALTNAGIAQKDIQTARFTVQPVYVTQQNEQKLSGYSVANQVSVTIRDIDKVGEILDRLIAAGATDAGSVQFLHSDTAKALDEAREKAMADAKRKAELYAHAAGMSLGAVNWIGEDTGYAPPPYPAMRALAAPSAAPVPIAPGEDTLRARITVGFDLAH